MTDRTGQSIGNYHLLRLLGQGTFAQVYLGRHRYLKSVAALKILRHALTEQTAQHFLEEAQTLVRLRHEHIVRVLDFAVYDGMAVLVMDNIAGGTLRQRYPLGTRLSLDTTVEYAKQVACALQYAHNHHVIHRDVKPENLLLDATERLVLSDFGLALFAPSQDLLATQILAGTLPYIAPEQARGKPCFASDQYALGILTYEWITGVRPFEGRPWEVLEQHFIAQPSPLRTHCPDLPVAIEQVVLRALAKNPQERYVSICAFAQALERAYRESRQREYDPQITAVSPIVQGRSAARHKRMSVQATVFLSASSNDEVVVARLAAGLKRQGFLLANYPAGRVIDQAEAMRMADHVVVAVTPRTRSSYEVREHLRLAQVYQRQPVLVWAAGNEIGAMLLDQAWAELPALDVIDARGDRYEVALEELCECLQEEREVYTDDEQTDSFATSQDALIYQLPRLSRNSM